MLLTVILAISIPLAFLYVIHWLDLYGSDRPRTVLLCVGWGVVAFLLSFAVNRGITIELLGMSRAEVGTRTAPFVEEVWKSLILVWLVHKGRLNYAVDGAVYGYASGIGFAAIENFRYLQLYPDNPVALIISRDFSSALAHGAATALTGIALGTYFSSHHRPGRWRPLLVGLAGAMALHYAWNNFAFFSPFDQVTTHWILVATGLVGLALIGATIMWGLRRERAALHDKLGLRVGVSNEESHLVEHLDDVDRLLEPLRARFGREKAALVADVLHLEARLGLAEDVVETAQDGPARAVAAREVAELERQIDVKRRDVGVYAMLYARSIFPETAWSLWARLAHTLAAPRSSTGRTLYPARRSLTNTGPTLQARVAAALAARPAPNGSHHDLAQPLQHTLDWLHGNAGATVQHAAQALGHTEARVKEMLDHLVERGLVHRTSHETGDVHHRAAPGRAPAKHNVWESPRRTPRHNRARGAR